MILETSLAKKLPLVKKLGLSKVKNFCLEWPHSQNPIVNETSFTIAFLYDLMVFGKNIKNPAAEKREKM